MKEERKRKALSYGCTGSDGATGTASFFSYNSTLNNFRRRKRKKKKEGNGGHRAVTEAKRRRGSCFLPMTLYRPTKRKKKKEKRERNDVNHGPEELRLSALPFPPASVGKKRGEEKPAGWNLRERGRKAQPTLHTFSSKQAEKGEGREKKKPVPRN